MGHPTILAIPRRLCAKAKAGEEHWQHIEREEGPEEEFLCDGYPDARSDRQRETANDRMMRAAERAAETDGVAFLAVTMVDGKPYAAALDPRRVLLHHPDGSMAESAGQIAKASDRWTTRGGPW